jgi:hypothetical protein
MNAHLQQVIEAGSIPVPEAGCWLWERSRTKAGYGDFRMGDRHFLAHRASYEAFKGAIPSGLHVLHACDTRCCVNPEHLSVGTNTDNIHDCCRKARNAKLSNEQVIAIREARAAGETGANLSRQFGVKECQIGAITSGRQRRFVGGPITTPRAMRK